MWQWLTYTCWLPPHQQDILGLIDLDCVILTHWGRDKIDTISQTIFKSPRVTGGLTVFYLRYRLRHRRSANTFQLSGKIPQAYFFKPHMVDLWVWENFWHPSRWPWVKVTKLPKRNTVYFVPRVKWEPLIQSLQNLVGISSSSCFPPD